MHRVPIRRNTKRAYRIALLFLAPALLIYTAFHVLPFLGTVVLSLTSYDGLSSPQFVGLENFKALVRSSQFRTALTNNLIWYVGEVLTTTVIALIVALLINSVARFRAFYRTSLFLPFILSWGVIGLLWSRIYNPFPEYGLLNKSLEVLGLSSLMGNWLGDANTAFYSVIVAAVWKGIGFNMVLFYAGLQNVPKELVEAARIDGARRGQVFRYVTLPALRPITGIVLVLGLINTFKVFDPVWVMTEGGPGYSSSLLATLAYTLGLNNFELGMSSAVSIVLVLFAGAAMATYLLIFRPFRGDGQ